MKLTPPPDTITEARPSSSIDPAHDRPPTGSDTPDVDVPRLGDEAGMTTAEYAVGTLAAVAFAVVLMTVVRSDTVQSALAAVIEAALAMGR